MDIGAVAAENRTVPGKRRAAEVTEESSEGPPLLHVYSEAMKFARAPVWGPDVPADVYEAFQPGQQEGRREPPPVPLHAGMPLRCRARAVANPQ
jgi:hypothetical protein